MSDQPKKTDSIFWAALEIQSPQERSAYLDSACGGDGGLRAQVVELLAAYPKAQRFLEQPVATLDVPPLAEGPGATIGHYKLLEEIGEGGMGVVYMAEQQEPVRRKVALKIIKPGMDTRQVVARFEAERQALALMDHPNIAKVFDGGTTASGRPYFVMELVQGIPLTEYCDREQLTTRERLELFVQVCHAVQHAHQKGIIHRDLKPSNVMVTLYDGVPVPKIIDFGVAKATGGQLTEKTVFTGYGQMIGTLEYMSPEQARLDQLDIDTRSDIYSLGVLLYELLSGQTPFDGQRLRSAAFDEMLRIIREEEPPKPSTRLSASESLRSIAACRKAEPAKLGKLIRRELDWIVMKALEKDRSRRYETASGFAADIERYLSDEPVLACPPSAVYRLRKFARRNKGPMLAVGLVLLALVAGIIGTTWSNVRIRQALTARDEVLSELQAQEQETRLAEREKTLQLALARWNEARTCRQARQPGQRYHSLEALAEAVRHLRSLDQLEAHRLELRNDAIASLTLWDVRPAKRLLSVPGHPQPWVAWFDPLGQHYASTDGPNVVSWRRLADDQVVHRWQWEGIRCNRLDVSTDGRYVAAFCLGDPPRAKYVCRAWDSVTGSMVLERPVLTWNHAFRPDGKVLALVEADGSIALCDLASGRNLPPLPAGPRPVNLRFHPSGQYLAVSSPDHQNVDVWDLAEGKVVFRLVGDRYRGGSLAWSPDGSLLAVGSTDTNIYVCTFPGGGIHAVLRGHEHVVTGVEFHPSGLALASTSQDDTTRLWCFSLGGELVLPGEQLLGFSRDGRRLATGPTQGGLTLWELANPGDCLQYLPYGQGPTSCGWGIAFAPDGRLLASASEQGVNLWDARAARLVGRVPSGDGHALAFHPKDRRLFTTGRRGLMQWPIVPDRDGQTLRVGPGTVVRPTIANSRSLRIDVAGTGERLVLGAGDGGVDLVPLAEPGGARRLGMHEGLQGVALSPDSRWAVSVGRLYDVPGHDDAVRIWDVAQGTLVRRLPLDGRDIDFGVTFSPDGRWLVTGALSGFYFREVGSWELKARLPRYPRSLFGLVAFTRDGGLLALAQGRNRIDLHEAATLRRLATLETPGMATLTGLSLSPDGTRLAAATNYNMIALWNLRRLRQELTALGLDWELPPYPSAGHAAEPVQALTVNVLPESPSEPNHKGAQANLDPKPKEPLTGAAKPTEAAKPSGEKGAPPGQKPRQ